MLQARDYTRGYFSYSNTDFKDNKLYALYTAIDITLQYTAMRYVPSQIVLASSFPKKLK